MIKRNIYFGFIATLVVLFVASLFAISIHTAHANPTQFRPTVQTAIATTSVSYMTPGTATTTLAYDSYAVSSGGQPFATDRMTLFVSQYASSSASTVNTNIEYSQDGIDWYQDGGTMVNGYATTSKPFDISQVNQFKFNFASSTAGLGLPGANSATTTRALLIATPTRFVRAVFSVPAGATNAGVWAQWIPARQISQ